MPKPGAYGIGRGKGGKAGICSGENRDSGSGAARWLVGNDGFAAFYGSRQRMRGFGGHSRACFRLAEYGQKMDIRQMAWSKGGGDSRRTFKGEAYFYERKA